MASDIRRLADRVTVNIPIEAGGSDATGQYFFDRCITLVISRQGATIVLARKLMPQQDLTLRNLQNKREAEVHVVGFIAKHEKGDVYGVKFVDQSNNIWDIDFPPASESLDAAFRLVMECLGCNARQVSYLDELETEVFRASGALRRNCEKCRDSTLWKESSGPAPEPAPEPAPSQAVGSAVQPLVAGQEQAEAPRSRTANDRKHVRSKMQIQICVRRIRAFSEEWNTKEEIELTDDCSRGGFCFQSYTQFKADEKVDVAIPYQAGGANIFVRARIANARKQKDGRYRYGVAYVR